MEYDALGRTYFAEKLADAIIKIEADDTYTIALQGKWGSGKTSVINLTLQKIDEKQNGSNEIAIMRFEPWNFVNTDQLIQQFFVQMKKAFHQKDHNKNLEDIAEAIEVYGGLFSTVIGTTGIGLPISFAGNVASKAIGRRIRKSVNMDLAEQKQNIETLLMDKKQKLLVVIDDIDRLNNQEIRLIFQLVASTANFSNTIYLLSFDRNIVINALKDVQKGDGNEYLEKIIQMPIRIPKPQGSDLQKIIIERFENLLKEFPTVNLDTSCSTKLFEYCVRPFIHSVRDINRLHNTLQFKLATIAEEIDFTDMAAITVMELYYPRIYEWIQENKPILTGEYDIQHEENDSVQLEAVRDKYKEIISSMISKDNQRKEAIIDMILESISTMFPYFGHEKLRMSYGENDKAYLKRGRHIGASDCFDRYFDLDPNRIVFRRNELQDFFLKNTVEENISLIREEIDAQGIDSLLAETQLHHAEIPQNRINIIIQSLAASFMEIIEKEDRSSFQFNAFRTVNLVMTLLEDVQEDQREKALFDLIRKADINSLSVYASVINSQYPITTERQDESPRKQQSFLPSEAKEAFWQAFAEKAKELLADNILFDFTYWSFIVDLLRQLDEKYVDSYYQKHLQERINVLRYISQFVREGRSSYSGWIYSIDSVENPYISNEQITNTVESSITTGEINKLSDKERTKAMAVYLFIKDGQKEREYPVSTIEDLFHALQN